ncbi:hypothetical protein CQA66_06840 [Helicobacter aurati]|uniref:Uncharacterized protein n=1 Tax=Helicobacter aurati TaxID=137778 RepID=A0A3D8J1K4_9HELI|nr:hypothetical protein [Helicobacter aurati]RDU71253.1 hypothetical protein CQA66_06840 [Helicobacter aurati]
MRRSCVGIAILLMMFVSAFAKEKDSLPIYQELKLKLYQELYPQGTYDMLDQEQKQTFIQSLISSNNGIDTYVFPDRSIEEVYRAYNNVHTSDNFGQSVLHKELPKTNKAFRKDSTKDTLGYVLMYIWKNQNSLNITNVRLQGEKLCGKETLDFEQNNKETTLKVGFEQYCFE